MTKEDLRLHLERLIRPADRKEMATWRRKSAVAAIPSEINRMTVTEWAEKRRVLPTDLSPVPGPFRFDMTPYLREICDALSESSDIRQIDIMKASRLGFTVGMGENWMGYTIDVAPAPMLYVSSDEETVKTVMKLRVNRMIQLSGLQDKIFAQARKRTGKTTGDTTELKEFPGGYIMAIGPNSGSKARDRGAKLLFFDETEAASMEMTGEGSTLDLIETRTKEWRDRKIVHSSTPKLEALSNIKPLVMSGDQRRFYVPCPHCEHFQTLKWGSDSLHYDKNEAGDLLPDSVYYTCEACQGRILEAAKYKMLNRGEWRATAVADSPDHRSYIISGLYSLFYTWADVCKEWIKAQGDPLKLQTFVNTTLGETWEEKGESIKAEFVEMRSDGYISERVNDEGKIVQLDLLPSPEILLVTLGADVQADRIECELVGWGRQKESWSLGYHVLDGDTSDLGGQVWASLAEVLMTKHGGFPVAFACIDANFRPDIVYAFCGQFEAGSGVMPIRGEETLDSDRSYFQVKAGKGGAMERALLNTNLLKHEIHSALKTTVPGGGFCHFPGDYPKKYYTMLTAEKYGLIRAHGRAARMGWYARGRNEAFDARVYNLGALYLYAHLVCEADGLEALDWDYFWDWMETQEAVPA